MHSGTVRRNSWRILGCKLGEFWHSLRKFWEVFVVRNLPKICHFESCEGPVTTLEEVHVHPDT